MTWHRAIEAFMVWQVAAGMSVTTVRLYRHYLVQLARRCPDGPWHVCTDELVALVATPGWTPETRKSARTATRAFYRWAYDTRRVSVNPALQLPSIKVPPGRPRPTPRDVVEDALARADARSRLMVQLALLAGLRRSEIAAVHTDDLEPDLEGLSLRVRGKGGRVRVIPLHDSLAAVLGAYRPGWVFPGKIDGHLSPGHVGRLLSRLLGPGWSGHTLRHRFATAAYAVERDLFAVQQLLGHAQPQTTARYTAVPTDRLRAAVKGVAAA